MAIFKRKRDASPPETPEAAAEEPEPGQPEQVPSEADAEASVGISVSSYDGFGARQPSSAPTPPRTRLGPELAPPPSETIPGLRDNVLLRDALAQLPAEPNGRQLIAVARNLLQGHLFLRVKGDARALLAAGKELPLAVATKDDQQFMIVYSSGAAIRASVAADGDAETSAMGQPVLTVLRYALAGAYAGIVIDPASSPASAIYPRAFVERTVEEADPQLELKTLLSAQRTAETAAQVVDALGRAKLWLAVGTTADGRPGIAEARSNDGGRYLEAYSHPLEVMAMGRSDRAAPVTGQQLAAALRADARLSGVIIDAAGPWMRLSRDELAPLFAG